MKLLFFLLSYVVCHVNAGVGVLTPEIEAAALALWQAHCEGASEGGMEGTMSIYCKKSQEKLEEALTHELQLKAGEGQQEQVVFIQPPSYHYKHDVVVSGGGSAGSKTVIYVKPSKNTHEVNIQDQTEGAGAPQKPQLFFLKGDHGGGGSEGAAASAAAPAESAAPEAAPAAAGGYGGGDADAPPPEGAARRRIVRQNGPHERIAAVPEPKKRTVYILRRSAFA